MDDAGWEEALWTDATRDAYLAQAEQAIAELRRHVALVAAATSENDEPRIDQSAESVRLAFIALSDAEFEYSSTLAPFSALETMTTRTPTWRTSSSTTPPSTTS